jgi:hypothetical protein
MERCSQASWRMYQVFTLSVYLRSQGISWFSFRSFQLKFKPLGTGDVLTALRDLSVRSYGVWLRVLIESVACIRVLSLCSLLAGCTLPVGASAVGGRWLTPGREGTTCSRGQLGESRSRTTRPMIRWTALGGGSV